MSPASIQLLKLTQTLIFLKLNQETLIKLTQTLIFLKLNQETLIFLNKTLIFLNYNHWKHRGQLFVHNNSSASHKATSSAIVQPNPRARAICSNGIIKPSSVRISLRVLHSLWKFTLDSSNHLLTNGKIWNKWVFLLLWNKGRLPIWLLCIFIVKF